MLHPPGSWWQIHPVCGYLQIDRLPEKGESKAITDALRMMAQDHACTPISLK